MCSDVTSCIFIRSSDRMNKGGPHRHFSLLAFRLTRWSPCIAFYLDGRSTARLTSRLASRLFSHDAPPFSGFARVPFRLVPRSEGLAGATNYYCRYTVPMPKRSSKRRRKKAAERDPNEIAKGIVDQVTESAKEQPQKNPAAVALGRLGGKKGGLARAASLSAEERSEIARKAACARWKPNR